LFLVAIAAAGLAASPAAAKEGVQATLATAIPLHAKEGTRLRVAWKLTYASTHRPFGANGVFVRLRSASGKRAQADAPTGAHTRGDYTAMVVVPDGGIADVEIGLHSWTSGQNGTHSSDLLFPIANDPLPGPPRLVPQRARGKSTAWFAVGGLAALLVLGSGFALRRRR
jgi:LPXTG-motif cell wall-anchored protein